MVGPSKHTYIHTHVHNEVTLVWGSLRLAPIICLRQLVPEGLNSATTDMIKKFLEHAGITNVHTGREHIWYCYKSSTAGCPQAVQISITTVVKLGR